MPQTIARQRKLALDLVVLAIGAGLGILASRFGWEAGHPARRGFGAILGGIYIAYFGLLFLLSYFFSSACYVFGLLSYLCAARSHPAGRHMALVYFVMSLGIGAYLVLIGLGVL